MAESIAVKCWGCDMQIEVENDEVGRMFVADFQSRHADHEDGS